MNVRLLITAGTLLGMIRRARSRSAYPCTHKIMGLGSDGTVKTGFVPALRTLNTMDSTASQDWRLLRMQRLPSAPPPITLNSCATKYRRRIDATPETTSSSASFSSIFQSTSLVKKLDKPSSTQLASVLWMALMGTVVKSSELKNTKKHYML
jgi:hypothetical protein